MTIVYIGRCEVCGSEVNTSHRAVYKVTGWEVKRGQGGANRIMDRKRVPNTVAHYHCVDVASMVGDKQGTLL